MVRNRQSKTTDNTFDTDIRRLPRETITFKDYTDAAGRIALSNNALYTYDGDERSADFVMTSDAELSFRPISNGGIEDEAGADDGELVDKKVRSTFPSIEQIERNASLREYKMLRITAAKALAAMNAHPMHPKADSHEINQD